MVFRPISEYAVIGNDNRIALVDADGSIDWCCFPHVAAPSVFARLLDADDGGHFAVRPTASYESEQAYRDATNVLHTRFETDTGRATLVDFMPVVQQQRPARYQHAIIRQFRCEEGPVQVEAEFVPRLDYARGETSVENEERHLVASHREETPPGDDEGRERLTLQVAGPLALSTRGDRAVGTAVLEAGDSLWFVLQYGTFRPMPPTKCRRERARTVDYWSAWSEEIRETAGRLAGERDWYDELVRSGLVLKLLINEQTGAIYAAPTTSLPEEYGGTRNWDYRYNWIRDAKFTIQALYNLGKTEEARRYFEWFGAISHDDPENIQPVYGAHGERDLPETELDGLSGYRYSRPVRVGNQATEQRQLDTHGTIVQGIYETLLHEEYIDREDWAAIENIVDHVCDIWDEKGAGIWEFREQPRHYVHSKLLCWVALDRGIELAERFGDADVDRWKRHRADVRAAIEHEGYSESAGSFVQHFETDDTFDAATLLIPVYGFLPPDDPRVENTIDTVLDELVTEEGLVHRTAGSDAPAEGRGAFLFCSFWLVDALVLADRVDEALDVFESVLEHVDPPHLLPERLDPGTGEYLGNYPQAFSHIGLVNSAVYLCSELSDEDLAHDPQDEQVAERLFRT